MRADSNHLTPSALRVVRLSVAMIREGEDVLIVDAMAFHGTARIGAMQVFEAEAAGSATPKTPATGGATARERESSGDVSVQWLTESLAELQRIADGEDEFGGQRDSVMGDLLTRGEAVAMEPDQEHTLRLEAFEHALDQAAKVNPWSRHLDKILDAVNRMRASLPALASMIGRAYDGSRRTKMAASNRAIYEEDYIMK